MCNLYSQTRAEKAVRDLFDIRHIPAPSVIEPLQAIFPGHTAPVVRKANVRVDQSATLLLCHLPGMLYSAYGK